MASAAARPSTIEARTEGFVRIRGANLAKRRDGTITVMNRHGELVVVDAGRVQRRAPA